MSNIKVHIPIPCHENWQKMSVNKKGRFCNVCDKTVVDFTNKNSDEIKSIIDNSTGKLCGRFKTTDVYQPTIPSKTNSSFKLSWYKSKWLAMTTILSLFGFSKKATAQGAVVRMIDNSSPIIKKTVAKKSSTVIHGWIKSIDEKKGIAQIEIRVYSGGKEIAYKQNFLNGSYFITVPENTIWDFKVDIEYSSVNYQTQILRDLPINKDRIKCDLNLAEVHTNVPFQTIYALGGIGRYYEEPIDYYQEKTTVGQLEAIEEVKKDSILNEKINMAYKLLSEQEVIAPETIKTETSFDVIAFPNPGIGLFNFRIENSEKSEIFIFDIEGRLIESRKTTAIIEQVDLTNHPNGTYVVRVVSFSQNKVKQLKLIKIE